MPTNYIHTGARINFFFFIKFQLNQTLFLARKFKLVLYFTFIFGQKCDFWGLSQCDVVYNSINKWVPLLRYPQGSKLFILAPIFCDGPVKHLSAFNYVRVDKNVQLSSSILIEEKQESCSFSERSELKLFLTHP